MAREFDILFSRGKTVNLPDLKNRFVCREFTSILKVEMGCSYDLLAFARKKSPLFY